MKLYSIQLKELGQKAFPHSERDCEKEIKGKFLQTVPSDFAQHVSRTEEMLSMVGRKMTYADLMSMAEKEDERLILQARNGKREEQAKIWFNRGSQNIENQKVFSHLQEGDSGKFSLSRALSQPQQRQQAQGKQSNQPRGYNSRQFGASRRGRWQPPRSLCN